MLVSGSALAATDHYVLRDGNHVQHLKDYKNQWWDFSKRRRQFLNRMPTKLAANPVPAKFQVKPRVWLQTNWLWKSVLKAKRLFVSWRFILAQLVPRLKQSKDCDNFGSGYLPLLYNGKELIKVKVVWQAYALAYPFIRVSGNHKFPKGVPTTRLYFIFAVGISGLRSPLLLLNYSTTQLRKCAY